MGGGIAQLAAFGAADQYLSTAPQITFWKQVWRRATAFALESIKQTWTGDCDFGRKCTITLSRAGDLVTECWLQVQLPDLAALNHITNATRLPGAPVITRARSTTEDGVAVDAYGCGETSYVLSLRAANSGVQSVGVSGGNLTIVLATAASDVDLAPLPSGPNVQMTQVGATVYTLALTSMAAGVSYAVQIDGNVGASLNHVVQLQTVGSSADPSFTVEGVDASVPRYFATVIGAGDKVSAEQIVMKARWVNSVGHALVSSVEWEMGGARIDRHTGEHWDLWDELTEKAEKRAGYSAMIGRYDDYDIDYDAKSFGGARTLFVPLRFSFNASPGAALPLVAMTFHNCNLNFEIRPFGELIRTNVPNLALQSEPQLDAEVYATYCFLSQEERIRFASTQHEYLLETLQSQVETVPSAASVNGTLMRKFTLTLSHPVKEIIWAFQAYDNYQRNSVTGNNWFDYDIPGREDEEIFQQASIYFNGSQRFSDRPARWFRLAVPWSHHTRCPTKKVHCYSFALYPEQWSPSGTANASRIDQIQLYMQFNSNIPAGRLRVHAVAYNVLRIANGLSGLVFAN